MVARNRYLEVNGYDILLNSGYRERDDVQR